MFKAWLRRWRRWLEGTARIRGRSRRLVQRPEVEPLEDRMTPAAILTVNSVADTNVRDNVLTLREAIMVAQGDIAQGNLTAAEQAQIQGLTVVFGLDTIN